MFKWFGFIFLAASVTAQFKCPQGTGLGTGFFPDPEECDLYYKCSRGQAEEKLCPDGLVFDDTDPNRERCVIPANVDCSERPILQEAKPSEGCPRANGYYPHPDPSQCNKFFSCDDGKHKEIACPPGLIFDEKLSICSWPDDSKRKGCFQSKKEDFDGFQCPGNEVVGSNGRKIPHPTFAHPDDCQKFIICRNGVQPTLGSCSPGTVYNEETSFCDDPKNVKGCEDFFGGKPQSAPKKP